MLSNDAQLLANWRQIAQTLTERIVDGQLKPGERIPSEFALAEEMGVSRQTVHRALAELKRQGYVVRQRRNGTVVSSATRGRTGMVALITDYTDDYPQSDLVRGIRSTLPDDTAVVHFAAGENPALEAEHLRRAATTTDGIFLYPGCDPVNSPLLSSLATSGTPIVLLDRVPDGVEIDAVLSDNYEVTLRGMRHLVASGHRRIGFFSGDNPQVSSVAERHRAYREVMEEAGTYDPTLERWYAKELESRPQRLHVAISDSLCSLLTRQDPPTAVFCTQDLYASTAREELDHLERSLEILTFNDWPPMMLRGAQNFHRIVQRPYEIGRIAAERLVARQMDPELDPARIDVGAELIPAAPPRAKTAFSSSLRLS